MFGSLRRFLEDNVITDLFNPNTRADQKRRVAQGKSRYYIKGEPAKLPPSGGKSTPASTRTPFIGPYSQEVYDNVITPAYQQQERDRQNRISQLQQQASQQRGLVNSLRDVFDANTAKDRLSRVQAKAPETYEEQKGYAPGESRGVVGQLAYPAVGAATNLVASIGTGTQRLLGTGLQALDDKLLPGDVVGAAGRGINQWADIQDNARTQAIDQSRFSTRARQGEMSPLTGLSSAAGSVIPSIAGGWALRAPQAAAAVGGGARGLLAGAKAVSPVAGGFGLSAGGQATREALEAGQSPTTSLVTGLGTGITEAGLEAVGFGKIGKPLINRALSESLQEMSQELGGNVWAKLGYDSEQDLLENVAQAGIYGGIIGGITSPAFDLATNKERQQVASELIKRTQSKLDPKQIQARILGKENAIEQTKQNLQAAQAQGNQRAVNTLSQQLSDLEGSLRVDRAMLRASSMGLSTQEVDPLDSLRQEARKYKTVHQDGKSIEVDGNPVQIADGIDTFIHQDENGNWAVSEATSGRSLTGGGYENKTLAIKAAKQLLDERGVDAVKKRIAEVTATQPTKGATGQTQPQSPQTAQTPQSPTTAPSEAQATDATDRTNTQAPPPRGATSTSLLGPGSSVSPQNLLSGGSIQLSPAQAKRRFKAIGKKGGVELEVVNPAPGKARTFTVSPKGIAKEGSNTIPIKQYGSEKSIIVDPNKPLIRLDPDKIGPVKDISNYAKGMKDFYRNTERVFDYMGEGKQAREQLLEPFDKAKGEFIDMQNDLLTELDQKIVKELGIKPKTKESEAVQRYGESDKSPQEKRQLLKDQYGFDEATINKIVKADRFFRQKYDSLIETVNKARAKSYPNRPDKQIPKRKNYYRHFREMQEGLGALANLFETPANIDPALAGVSDFTKPKSKFLGIAQKRLGGKTEVDAVGGYLDYIRQASYATTIDPQIKRIRDVQEQLVQLFPEGDVRRGSLNNYIEFLNDFANDLSGKTNPADRVVQKFVPGGRMTFRGLDWLNKRVKANLILGNASSSIAQFFNLPQGLADAKLRNVPKGAGQAINAMFGHDTPASKSVFLKERYFSGYDQFDTGILTKPKQFAAWMIQAGDQVGTHLIWHSQYQKARSEMKLGESQAITYADNQTRKMVAGRGVGEVPLIQKSRAIQMVAPFQLEVQNLWHSLGPMVGKKEFGKLANFAVLMFLMNGLAERLRGSDVAFDPIRALIEGVDAFEEEEDKKVGAIRGGGRVAGELLSNVFFGQSLAGLYPEFGVKVGDETITREELFGDADPTRFGSGPLFARGLTDPFAVLPPFGGQQIKRTKEGIEAGNRGYSETKSGRVRFPTENDTLSNLQRAVFGQYSTPNARQYFDSGNSSLGENQSQQFKELPKDQRQGFYDEVMQTRAEKRGEGSTMTAQQARDRRMSAVTNQQSFSDRTQALRDETKIRGKSLDDIKSEFNLPDSVTSYERAEAHISNNYEDFVEAYNLDTSDQKRGTGQYADLIEKNTASEKITKARNLYKGEGSMADVPDWVKQRYYKEAGVTEPELELDIAAGFKVADKAEYIAQQIGQLQPNERINKLAEWMKPTVSGKYFASYGVIDELEDKGLLSDDQAKALKRLKWDEESNKFVDKYSSSGGSGSGGSGMKYDYKLYGGKFGIAPSSFSKALRSILEEATL